MNAVVIAVIVMLVLAVCRVHVVVALFIGAIVGGLVSGIGLEATMVSFQAGLGNGAVVALSYALLGAFAMAVANSGLPQAIADAIIRRLDRGESASTRAVNITKYAMIGGILLMAIFSQNLIPVHIAFIPLLIPPLLTVFNRLRIDRRLIACVITFGLVTTYMYVPLGFGKIFLEDILLRNIELAGLDTSGISVMQAMTIPALGMLAGLLIAIFISYRKPRDYEDRDIANPSGARAAGTATTATETSTKVSAYRITMSIIAILACFGVQLALNAVGSEANGLMIGALLGLAILLVTGAVRWGESDDVFTQGIRMMALIGFIMITAQGFAAVMTETGHVEPLVAGTAELFGDNKAVAAFAMLLVGLLVTMGIGSSFSTLPIISTAGALGDAGSPASDSTLGPTAGLNADGQHDHIRDSVIPTFLHYNIPLLGAGWIAAMVL